MGRNKNFCGGSKADSDEGKLGGADGDRTHDLLNAIQALSQLSYGPSSPFPAGDGV
jgi:hypothetical protein